MTDGIITATPADGYTGGATTTGITSTENIYTNPIRDIRSIMTGTGGVVMVMEGEDNYCGLY
jgi:hypothetical protein